MTNSESIELLEKLTGQHEDKAFSKLAEELGHLPLALEQVGAYINANSITTGEYLKLFKGPAIDLESRLMPSDDYPLSVTMTFDITLEKVAKKSKAAREFLNLCAFLAPDDIPVMELKKGADHLPENIAKVLKNTRARNNMLKLLEGYSLIENDEGSVSLHRFVQKIIRDELDPEEQKSWLNKIIILIDSVFNFEQVDLKSVNSNSRITPHAIIVLKYCETINLKTKFFGNFLNKICRYFIEIDEHARAEIYLKNYMNTDNLMLEKDSLTLAGAYSCLAYSNFKFHNHEKALELLHEILKIYKKVYGAKHAEVAMNLKNISIVYSQMDNHEKALHYCLQALKIFKHLNPEGHPETGNCYNLIGSLMLNLNKPDKALFYFNKGFNIIKSNFGMNHIKTVVGLMRLGALFNKTGKYKKGLEYYKKAEQILEKFKGHAQVKGRLAVRIGACYISLNRSDESIKYLSKGLSIPKSIFGDENVDVGVALGYLGKAMKVYGDLISAKQYSEQALKIFKMFYKHDHHFIKGRLDEIKEIDRMLRKRDAEKLKRQSH